MFPVSSLKVKDAMPKSLILNFDAIISSSPQLSMGSFGC